MTSLITALAPAAISAGANLLSNIGSGVRDRVQSNIATGAGTGGGEEMMLRLQKEAGLTPEQAAKATSTFMQQNAQQQQAMSREDMMTSAALQTNLANNALRRAVTQDAQAQQGQLATNLVNSIQNARSNAIDSMSRGAAAVAGLSNTGVR